MVQPSVPSVGLSVLHLFFKVGEVTDGAAVADIVAAANTDEAQAVCAAILGPKADLGIMLLAPDQWQLRTTQTALVGAGLELVDGYVSLTELSEYAQGVPDAMRQARLHPQLPPEGKPAFCFYPMSKRRGADANWFTLAYDERKDLMYEHGASGRKFAGRVLQVVTGSTGTDDFEWGVTLFAEHPDDLKEVVYTMRFDEASARYGEFGSFWVGMVAPIDEVMASLGADPGA